MFPLQRAGMSPLAETMLGTTRSEMWTSHRNEFRYSVLAMLRRDRTAFCDIGFEKRGDVCFWFLRGHCSRAGRIFAATPTRTIRCPAASAY